MIRVVVCSFFFSLAVHNISAAPFNNAKQLPSFWENKGQVVDQYGFPRPDIQFRVQATNNLNIFIGSGAMHYQFSKAINEKPGTVLADLMALKTKGVEAFYPIAKTHAQMDRMDIELLNANTHAEVTMEQKQACFINYYNAGTGANGITVSSYNKVTYKNIYPNIDWVLQFEDGKLKHNFIVRQGGNVNDIQLKYSGQANLHLDDMGALVAKTPQGTIIESAPYTYQIDGKKINSRFILDGNLLSYSVGEYTGTLVIDPTLLWATYYGDADEDGGSAVAADGSGNVYVAGSTKSYSNIATTGAYATTYGGGSYDAFLVKFNAAGVREWATYYGGSDDDKATSLALDKLGNIYLSGNTASLSAIATPGACQFSHGGLNDGFLIKFNNSGARQWGTYYGGNANDITASTVVDGMGNIFLSGYTFSSNGISTPGAHKEFFTAWPAACGDVFLIKFDNTGVRQWGTYYGCGADDYPGAICTDNVGNIYMTTFCSSPTGVGCASELVKFYNSGAEEWHLVLSCGVHVTAKAVASDRWGNVYIAGNTDATSGISTPGGHQFFFGGGSNDAFIIKYSDAGVKQWGAYYGGADVECIQALATDEAGNVYATGATQSTSMIATSDAFQNALGGAEDGFLVKFDSVGVLKWGSYYGGSTTDVSYSIFAAGDNDVYIAGFTTSTSGIATSGTHQVVAGGLGDAFVAKFNVCTTPTIATLSGVNNVCVGNTVTLMPSAAGGIWNTINGSALVSAGGVVTGMLPGVDTVTYTIIDACGVGTKLFPVTVKPANYCATNAGIINSATESLQVYPNPAQGKFSVMLHSQNTQDVQMAISNIMGEKVHQFTAGSNKAIDVTVDLSPGIYILSAHSETGTYEAKIIVQ
jgi:hypothetical protein